ncbi:MAG TPA: hypothetical protein VN369_04775 [Terriglobales bacterium]|nr:hypothetical protein [Terriglobales bacterium]
MRKMLPLLMAAVLIFAPVTAAGASDYEGLAGDLAAIGMFKGMDEGYDLDRAPTRAEVAVMLVRMLGAEAAAKDGYADGSLSCPFTDLPEWAAPCVAYLYTKGLTSGLTDTEFGSEQPCSGQMYCTFMLRVLGYSDAEGGDFTYAEATRFAEEQMLTFDAFVADPFTRDELVAVSHQTLCTQVKGGGGTLLEKLVAAGTVGRAAAAAIDRTQDILLEFSAVAADSVRQIHALDCGMGMEASARIQSGNATMTYAYDLLADLKFILADTASSAELATTLTDPSTFEPIEVHAWVKDGWLYLQMGEEQTKTQLDYDEVRATFNEVMSSMDTAAVEEAARLPAYLFSSVTKEQTADGTLYTFSLSPKFLSAAIHSSFDEAAPVVKINDFTQSALVREGVIRSVNFDIDLSVTTKDYGHIAVKVDFDLAVNGINDEVTIDFPDFTDFVDESAQTQGE